MCPYRIYVFTSLLQMTTPEIFNRELKYLPKCFLKQIVGNITKMTKYTERYKRV